MNAISPQIRIGTLGELLVQARLLQYGVQAAPPIKDSGNGLIAVRGESFRAIQVKTRTEVSFSLGSLPPLYHILALVRLVGEDQEVYLDDSCVFLVPRDFVESRVIRSFADVADFAIGIELVAH